MATIQVNIIGTEEEKRIARAICAIPAGRFFRLRYANDVPLAAEYKNQGYTMRKMVNTTTRTGVYYPNISGVVLNESAAPRTNNWETVVPNRIKKNTKTGKYYVMVAPIAKGHHAKVTYELTDPNGNTSQITREEAHKYTTASYWREGSKPAIITIALGNIKHIK